MSEDFSAAPSAHRSSQFAAHELDRVVPETAIDRVDYHPRLDSTNTRARALAAKGDHPNDWTLVLTDEQTAGRGRGANRWWSADGAITFSVLVPAQAIELTASRWPQVSLVAGLAVCAAIERSLEHDALALKWPNDVYLRGRKLCGILVEAADGPGGHLIIGIGVNVNNSAASAPEEIRDTAIALVDAIQPTPSRVDVLVAILNQLTTHLQRLAAGDVQLSDQWRERSLLTDRNVEIDLGARQLIGICRGIDDDGALVVETASGRERCISGIVTRFE